jgi:hypothetical protein
VPAEGFKCEIPLSLRKQTLDLATYKSSDFDKSGFNEIACAEA